LAAIPFSQQTQAASKDTGRLNCRCIAAVTEQEIVAAETYWICNFALAPNWVKNPYGPFQFRVTIRCVNFSEEWQPAVKVLGTDTEARESGRNTFAKWLRDREIDFNELKVADFRIDSARTPDGPGLMFSVKKTLLDKAGPV
jgi:hypothetical protein